MSASSRAMDSSIFLMGDRSAEEDTDLGDVGVEIDNFPSFDSLEVEENTEDPPMSPFPTPKKSNKGKTKVS